MGLPTTITGKLGGDEVEGIEELEAVEFQAIWENGDLESSITTSTFKFKGDAHEKLMELFNILPTENPDFEPTVNSNGLIINKKYAVNLRDLRILSDVESEATITADEGNADFLDRAKGVTMQLLKEKGLLTDEDWVRVPYIVENRKRLMEFLILQISIIQTTKEIFDTVFKLVNIVSDIASGVWFTTVFAAVIAIINLIKTIIHLIILTIKLVLLLRDLFLAVFPPIRYHLGISLYNWLNKATQFLGYSLQVGLTFQFLLERVTLLGSKNDHVGPFAVAVEFTDLFEILKGPDIGDGLLNPSDFGYTFWEAIELTKKMFYTKNGIQGTVFHLKPHNDPFWQNLPTYTLPDVLIEEALDYQNGSFTYNYGDMVSRTLIRYERDESDLHTLTDTNNRVAEVIWEPISVSQQRRVNMRGIDLNEIPYCLNVPKPAKDNLFTRFDRLEKRFALLQTVVDEVFDEFPALGDNVEKPNVAKFLALIFIRKNALMVENHFFSVPKIILIDPVTGRIQEGFAEEIGADALYMKYHSWKAMAPGFKNPDDIHDTFQKKIFKGVRIPFGPLDWEKTILNNEVTTTEGKGEFTDLLWKAGEDHATASFFIFKRWNSNIKGTLYILGPQAAAEPAPGG